jgi:uncharacterized protein YegP (UPF0339 family)
MRDNVPTYRIDVYLDIAGEWRWRLVAENGQIVATSGEGYINRADCQDMANTLFSHRVLVVEASR